MKTKKMLLSAFTMALLLASCGGEKSEDENKDKKEGSQNEETVEEEVVAPDPVPAEELRNIDKVNAEAIAQATSKDSIYRYASEYNLEEIPAVVFEATNLQTIELNNFRGDSIPKELLNLPNLTVLYMSGANNITSLPDFLPEMKSLKTIAINNAKSLDLTAAFKVLSKCPQIQNVQITYSSVESEIPEEIGNMKNLKILDISSNHIVSFHDAFFILPNLKRLRISSSKDNPYDYEMLFEKMKTLPQLEKLSIYYAGLKELPDVLAEYPALKSMNWREDGKGWEDADAIRKTKEKWNKKFENIDLPVAPYESVFYDFY